MQTVIFQDNKRLIRVECGDHLRTGRKGWLSC